MRKLFLAGVPAAGILLVLLASNGPVAAQNTPNLSFFITSAGSGNGANLGGLAGADAICQKLAAAVGAGGKTWRAYLSTSASGNQAAVNARDRIGRGPWQNAKGVVVAQSVDDLHSDKNRLGKEGSLTEKGAMVNGRGDSPNTHDILTGSTRDGRPFQAMRPATTGRVEPPGALESAITTNKEAATTRTPGTRRTARVAAARRISYRPAAPACSTASRSRAGSCSAGL